MEKYWGFWPLPGGNEKYVDSLNDCLRFVKENRPSEDQLEDWFIQKFSVSKGSAHSYVRVVIRQSGLVNRDAKGVHSLTEDGNRYLSNPNSQLLFTILDDHVLGFRETLQIIRSTEMDFDSLSRELAKKTNMSWETEKQPLWRVGWLRSMKLVTLQDGKLRLTEQGMSVASILPELEDTHRMPKEDSSEKSKPQVEQPNRGLEARQIIDYMRGSQHLARESSKFEEAIARAFNFLGFNSKQIGGAGDTDVFAEASLGEESYSIVIDGKTTEGGRIPENQIRWPTLRDHKDAHKADFILVVGPAFAGGDLVKRAIDYKVTLIDTETLITLIDIHDRAPLNLEDLRKLFTTNGVLNRDNLEELMTTADDYDRQQKLFPKVLQSLYELQIEGEPTHVSDVRWKLNKEYEQDDIQETLDLLEKWNLVRKWHDNRWIALMAPRIAAHKLQAIVNSFRISDSIR